MTTLTLLTKTKYNEQLKQVHQALQTQLNGLDIEARILGTVGRGWIQLSLSGEDEAIATNYLVQEIGLCPSSFDKVKFSTVKGYIDSIKSDGSGLYVDVGIFNPEIVLAFIPLNSLQIGLVNGMNISLGKLADLFGFCEGLPIRVTINSLNENETFLDARLSSGQIEQYQVWRESLLQRLLVIYPSLHEIDVALKHSKLYRDVIKVQPLGFFTHALTCKLGTDAAGLIPKIGKTLKKSRFAVFNPVILRAFLKK